MRTTKPCYAIVIPCDGSDGEGRPIVMEGYLDLSLAEVAKKAAYLEERYGDALIIELPICLAVEVNRVAGSEKKVIRPEEILP